MFNLALAGIARVSKVQWDHMDVYGSTARPSSSRCMESVRSLRLMRCEQRTLTPAFWDGCLGCLKIGKPSRTPSRALRGPRSHNLGGEDIAWKMLAWAFKAHSHCGTGVDGGLFRRRGRYCEAL